MRVKTSGIACIASVSVRFRSKERGRKSNTTRKIAQVTLTIPLLPQFHFLALVPFLVPPKPKVSFLGLSLLRNQTETPRLLCKLLQGQLRLLLGTEEKMAYSWPARQSPIAFPEVFTWTSFLLFSKMANCCFTADDTAAMLVMFSCKFCDEKLYFLDLSSLPCHVEANKEYKWKGAHLNRVKVKREWPETFFLRSSLTYVFWENSKGPKDVIKQHILRSDEQPKFQF